jgi:general secretion pathway protein H
MISRSDRRTIARCNRRPCGVGFTLIELLVVLAVTAVLLALVPAVTAGIADVRFRAAARELTVALRETQATALGSGQEIDLAIDTRTRFWRSSADGQRHDFPRAIHTVAVRFPDRMVEAPVLRFMPDGSASVAVLDLGGAGRHAEITIDGLIGKVRLDD